jgi:hypothetical protein
MVWIFYLRLLMGVVEAEPKHFSNVMVGAVPVPSIAEINAIFVLVAFVCAAAVPVLLTVLIWRHR